MAQEYEIIKGFSTEQGEARYDYESLHGKPDIKEIVNKALTDFVPPVDPDLTTSGAAADAAATGIAIQEVKDYTDEQLKNFKVSVDNTLKIEGQAADAKATGDAIQLAIEETKEYINEKINEYEVTVDATLTEEGKAADAKSTGDAIQTLKQDVNDRLAEVPYFDDKEHNESVQLVNADSLGGEPAQNYAKKSEVTNLGTAIEDRLNDVNKQIADLTAEDVGARPENWLPDLSEIDAVPTYRKINNKELNSDIFLSAADVGAASNEYGLGGNGKSISDPNLAINNGWYMLDGTDSGHTPVEWGNMKNGTIFVERRYDLIYQTIKHGFYEAKRFSNDTGVTWQPWEWVNPPMELGREYRTTERHQGKPVYAKVINFGPMPNATQTHILHGLTPTAIVDLQATTDNGKYFFPCGSATATVGYVDLYIQASGIYITTTANWSGYKAYVTVKFTKD